MDENNLSSYCSVDIVANLTVGAPTAFTSIFNIGIAEHVVIKDVIWGGYYLDISSGTIIPIKKEDFSIVLGGLTDARNVIGGSGGIFVEDLKSKLEVVAMGRPKLATVLGFDLSIWCNPSNFVVGAGDSVTFNATLEYERIDRVPPFWGGNKGRK